MKIRDAINKELRGRDWTVYRLAKEVRGKVPQAAVYEYLKGEREIGVGYLEPLLAALGLVVKRERPGTRPGRKLR